MGRPDKQMNTYFRLWFHYFFTFDTNQGNLVDWQMMVGGRHQSSVHFFDINQLKQWSW